LLLAQILQCLPGELLRGNGIAGLLQECSPSLIEEGNHSRVERIEGLASTAAMTTAPSTPINNFRRGVNR
jgi:hypothetical protein